MELYFGFPLPFTTVTVDHVVYISRRGDGRATKDSRVYLLWGDTDQSP